jgi:hypothetical protein
MILALEVILTLMGIWMLCTGKSWGKNKITHWQFRLLGGLLLTLFPLAFILVMGITIIYAASHPDVSPDQLEVKLKWPMVGVEAGVVIFYGIAAAIWESSIRKKVTAQAPAEPPELFTP